MTFTKTLLATASAAIVAAPLWADGHSSAFATAQVSGADGLVGQVTLNETASGMVLVQIELTGVPEGVRAVHLHEVGDCSATDFSSAGGHIAGDHDHGFLAANGPHPGDMPNATIGADGVLKSEVVLASLDLEAMIADVDGASFVMHDGVDDYTSQPSGAAGSRIACGVFEVAS